MTASALNSSFANDTLTSGSSLNDSLSSGAIMNGSAWNCFPLYSRLPNGYTPSFSSSKGSSLKSSSLNCYVTNSSSLSRSVTNCSSINGSLCTGNGSAINSFKCNGLIMSGSISGSYTNGCAISGSSLNSSSLSIGLTKNISAMTNTRINSSAINTSRMSSSGMNSSMRNSSTVNDSTTNGSIVNSSTMNSSTTSDSLLNCSSLDEPFVLGTTREVESFKGEPSVSERFLPAGKVHLNRCSTYLNLEARCHPRGHGVDSNPDHLSLLRSTSSTKRSLNSTSTIEGFVRIPHQLSIHRIDPESESHSYLLLPHQSSCPSRLNQMIHKEEEEDRQGAGQAPKVALSSSFGYEDDEPVPVKRFCGDQRSNRSDDLRFDSGQFTRFKDSIWRAKERLRNPEDRRNRRSTHAISVAVPSSPDVTPVSDVTSYHDVTSSVGVTASLDRISAGCRPRSRTMTAAVTTGHRIQSPDSTSDRCGQSTALGQ